MSESIFDKFIGSDFEVVRLKEISNGNSRFRIIDVAKAIIDASREGRKPVNFLVGSQEEYWTMWTNFGNGRLLDLALEHCGYERAVQTNETLDGRYYLLRRKEE